MIGAGTIISPIIKIVTTVAILAAVYFFFVKPTLDTTEKISTGISDNISESFDEFDNFTPDVQKDVNKAVKQAQQASGSNSNDIDKLFDCINAAGTDVNKINTCNAKFSP
ncbi:MAG: hypothetical protein ACR2G3_03000 [Solirubrobacterales bacterium]